MNNLKNIQNMKVAALAATFLLLIVTGCKKDEDDPVTPAAPTNPVASWTCTENSHRDGTAQPFTVHINNGLGDTLLVENFYAAGFDKKAKIIHRTDDSVFVKPLGQAVTAGVILLSGYGKFTNASTLKMRYIMDDGQAIKDTVDATFAKQ